MNLTSRNIGIVDWLGRGARKRMPDLGAREIAVLQCLWKEGRSSAQDVLTRLGDDEVTLSTIQSTLERLTRKGLLHREKRGRAYRYAARYSRPELIGRLIRDIAEDVAGGELAPMMSGFAEYVAGEAPELEADLGALRGYGECADD